MRVRKPTDATAVLDRAPVMGGLERLYDGTRPRQTGADTVATRAEFLKKTRRIIAERAGYRCSVPNCAQLTVGPGITSSQTADTGMAAHIYAAAEGGPRGTGGLSERERSLSDNGIWCCYRHGKMIDAENGNAYSAHELKGWKRLHEARTYAEFNGMPRDRYGFVESVVVNSAPASLSGRSFEFGMRNLIVGPNASGKTILSKLIASVSAPRHVADLSRDRDVDISVDWFDPLVRNVRTTGRAGKVRHVLDGKPVPYVARHYKPIVVAETHGLDIGNLDTLSQLLALDASAL